MKKYFLATVSVLALSNTGHASDLPAKVSPYAPVAMPAWTGLYLGIQGGVARFDASFKDLGCAFECGTFDGNKTGGAIGGLLGYNWQTGNFVYGLEGDWIWTGVKTAPQNGIFDFHADSSFDVRWIATVRGRAGLALDATLIYFTGGVAFGRVNNDYSIFNDRAGTLFTRFTQNRTNVGWTAGVGLEHMFGPHWTARAEFRYIDLGTRTVGCTEGSFTVCTDLGYRGEFSNTLMMGLVGLNYKF
jgi:outer membrane immunogenic protein